MPFAPANPHRFKPGQSGNPSGRPAETLEQKARKLTDPALKALVLDLADPDKRAFAACAILDRGWGKPTQSVNAVVNATHYVGGVDLPPRETLEQWLQRRKEELRRLDAPKPNGENKE